MAILVTGGSGFVASNIVRHLAASGAEVVSFDLSAPDELMFRFLGELTRRVHFVEGDIRDAKLLYEVGREHLVDRIVHAAVISAFDPASEMQNPAHAVEVNIMGTVCVLDAARRLSSLRRMIYVSSAGVYGRPKDQNIALDEEYPVDLSELYAISKYASEQITRRYRAMYDLDAISVRLAGPYGPMDRPTWARSHRNVICDVVGHALRGETISITRDGLARSRDWTYVQDTARGIGLLLLAPNLRYDLYNISVGHPVSVEEVIDATLQHLPKASYHLIDDPDAVNINLTSGRPRGPLSTRRITEDTGFSPCVSLHDGVGMFIDWWRANYG